jgi:DNA repair exonuclease SbcCD ATPase subunit
MGDFLLKILSLYLKNFTHIQSGLGKYEIDIDLSVNNKIVNIIIGKMGTCKSVILGHLQPFATFGTLDSRNQDDVVISNMDGEKKITYKKGIDIYDIIHKYTWNKNTHIIKSYIEKNGIELNPNGNQGSFKLVIENEFGIEQDFLRLFRLGTNVSNIINMKSTERKNYIALLLKETEYYLFLYKKLSEEMRNLNTQINVLTNKLNHIGIDKEEKIQEEFNDNNDEINELSRLREDKKNSLYSLKGQITGMLDGCDVPTYKNEYMKKQQSLFSYQKELYNVENLLVKYIDAPSIIEVSKIIGGIDMEIFSSNKKLNELEDRYKNITSEINTLNDGYKISKNKNHINELQLAYDELVNISNKEHRELEYFKCNYSISFLTNLLGDLNSINILIEEISQYNKEIISKLFNSDNSVINWSRKQIEILNFKKMKLQKEMNNIRYSEKYEAPSTLYLPLNCPTKSCPYYKTHPFNIQKEYKNSDINAEVTSILDQCNKIDIDIYKYNDYPLIYSKLITLKAMWKKIYPILSSLKILKTQSLLQVLTNLESRVWYSYDDLINTMELCEKRDRYNESIEKLNAMKSELAYYKLHEDDSVEEKINSLENEKDTIIKDISLVEHIIKESTIKISEYNNLYLELSELSIREKEKDKLIQEIEMNKKILGEYQKNIDIIEDNEKLISSFSTKILELDSKLSLLINRNNSIKTTLNDIQYTRDEYKSVYEEKEILKDILDAVSSKEGIPLMMVKIFLSDSKDILNGLLSDVFDESIEILDFRITEDEFYIPYSINGIIVKDIEKASQGQRSIISLALSFALIQNITFDYNIMLLDEVDGPLYKHDRERFLTIFFKHLSAINAEQAFLITHNNTFDGQSINIIMTSDEIVDKTPINNIMKVY